jgi:hypothetical protein
MIRKVAVSNHLSNEDTASSNKVLKGFVFNVYFGAIPILVNLELAPAIGITIIISF